MSQRLRRILLCAVTAAVTAVTAAAAGTAAQARPERVTVMTRNVYLGTGLDGLFTAPTPQALAQTVRAEWANVVATDFPARARALAGEIQRTRPDLVGLQEVQLYRQQTPADLSPAPNATTPAYDFLALLQQALAARGLRYSVVTTATNVDVEAARADPTSPNGLTDVRLTDRDVLLKNDARAGLSVLAAASGTFTARVSVTLPATGQPLTVVRGFNQADIRLGDRRFRIVNTHLEPLSRAVQVAQGAEALRGPLDAAGPVILVCDCNSPADRSGTATYADLVAGGFRDAWPHGRPGDTCCQAERLDNRRSRLDQRIDLVLYRPARRTRALRATRTGARPFRRTRPPRWASDHAGVVARLVLR